MSLDGETPREFSIPWDEEQIQLWTFETSFFLVGREDLTEEVKRREEKAERKRRKKNAKTRKEKER